eukprot:jgi/Tetstr1/442769/TSEL_030855.t2
MATEDGAAPTATGDHQDPDGSSWHSGTFQLESRLTSEEGYSNIFVADDTTTSEDCHAQVFRLLLNLLPGRTAATHLLDVSYRYNTRKGYHALQALKAAFAPPPETYISTLEGSLSTKQSPHEDLESFIARLMLARLMLDRAGTIVTDAKLINHFRDGLRQPDFKSELKEELSPPQPGAEDATMSKLAAMLSSLASGGAGHSSTQPSDRPGVNKRRCYYCGIPGHPKRDCRSYARDKAAGRVHPDRNPPAGDGRGRPDAAGDKEHAHVAKEFAFVATSHLNLPSCPTSAERLAPVTTDFNVITHCTFCWSRSHLREECYKLRADIADGKRPMLPEADVVVTSIMPLAEPAMGAEQETDESKAPAEPVESAAACHESKEPEESGEPAAEPDALEASAEDPDAEPKSPHRRNRHLRRRRNHAVRRRNHAARQAACAFLRISEGDYDASSDNSMPGAVTVSSSGGSCTPCDWSPPQERPPTHDAADYPDAVPPSTPDAIDQLIMMTAVDNLCDTASDVDVHGDDGNGDSDSECEHDALERAFHWRHTASHRPGVCYPAYLTPTKTVPFFHPCGYTAAFAAQTLPDIASTPPLPHAALARSPTPFQPLPSVTDVKADPAAFTKGKPIRILSLCAGALHSIAEGLAEAGVPIGDMICCETDKHVRKAGRVEQATANPHRLMLADPRAGGLYGSIDVVKRLASMQSGGVNFILENVPGAARCHEIVEAMGTPILHGLFSKFVSRRGSYAYRMTTATTDVPAVPGKSMLLLDGEPETPMFGHRGYLAFRSDNQIYRLFSSRQAEEHNAHLQIIINSRGSRLEVGDTVFPVESVDRMYVLHSRIERSGPPAGISLVSAVKQDSKYLWHARLGHIHERAMDALRGTAGTQVDYSTQTRLPFCHACAMIKATAAPRPRACHPRPDAPCHMLGCDFWENPTRSLQGNSYAFGAVDYASSWCCILFVRSRAAAVDCLRRVLAIARSMGHTVRALRLDNDSVFRSRAFIAECDAHALRREYSAPYSQFQNGLVERTWRTLWTWGRCMLAYAGLPTPYWQFAMATAVYLHNRTPRSTGAAPMSIVAAAAPDLSHLRVFGCPAYVHQQRAQRIKSDPSARLDIFVGYDALHADDCYLVYFPDTNTTVATRNVTFNEHWVLPATPSPATDVWRHATQEGPAGLSRSSRPRIDYRNPVSARHLAWSNRDHAHLAGEAPGDPQTHTEALTGPDAPHWLEAMWVEYRSLIARKTWVLVTLPSGRKAVRCKWVFKTKRNADGSLARYKARLVAKGFSQVHGIDYNDTFAPTVKFTTLRIIFSLAAHYGMELEQTDIDCAFLYADLEEDIYMTQAPEFEQQGPNGEELVYHLKKSVYGLKQAPHDWYLKLREHMLGQGFAQLKTDPGAYIYRSGNTFSIVAIYVDDILICSNCTTWVVQFKRNLADEFDIKDPGACTWILGMKVERDRDAGTIKIHQGKYVTDLLERFNMTDCNPADIPSVGNDARDSPALDDPSIFRSLIGGLMYPSTATRPDITEAVNRLCIAMSAPTRAHMEDAKHVLRYLKKYPDRGITFGGSDVLLQLAGWSDSNHATMTSQGKATCGFYFTICGGAVSYKSLLQSIVTLSTAEAEYVAMAIATQEVMFIRQMLQELGLALDGPTPIGEDNQACIAIATNDVTSSRTKHMDIRYHFVREACKNGDISIHYVETREMAADMFTKPLRNPLFAKFAAKVMQFIEEGC